MSETLIFLFDTIVRVKNKRFLFFNIKTYRLTPVMIYLLRQITGTDELYIQNLTVLKNKFLPLFGYDAITFGRKSSKACIVLGKSFFNCEKQYFDIVNSWTDILSHEITHIPQINKYRILCFGFIPYIFAQLFSYMKAFSHDKAVTEAEPIASQKRFAEFKRYTDKTISKNALAKLILDTELSDNEKISALESIFLEFQSKRKG